MEFFDSSHFGTPSSIPRYILRVSIGPPTQSFWSPQGGTLDLAFPPFLSLQLIPEILRHLGTSTHELFSNFWADFGYR